MHLIRFYYGLKPLIPRSVQIKVRRGVAKIRRKSFSRSWPILEKAGRQPEGWKGWPDNKKFALAILHDVDSILGLTNCLRLLDLDLALGIKASFNFVAEDYWVPLWYLQKIKDNGFEVGLHGLTHDARLFLSRKKFDKAFERIKYYQIHWGAVGFVAPSMICNQKWLTEFNLMWGCSSFDTDPFEPQRQDVHTIFPFYVKGSQPYSGYIEIPYTLPQDHALFVILQEKDIQIWKRKIDWIAQQGGLAMLNVHPDYLNFENRWALDNYPANLYIDFINYVKEKYEGQYWLALPREIAQFWKENYVPEIQAESSGLELKKLSFKLGNKSTNTKPPVPATRIWIDLDNTPHVPFFIPIIRELERRGHQIVISARDAFQVCQLADQKGLRFTKAGKHYGKNPIKKIWGLFFRGFQLIPFIKINKPELALSHGARSQVFIANLLGLPSILMSDYEYSRTIPPARARWLIVPEALMGNLGNFRPDKIKYYRGLKEDVYIPYFEPDFNLSRELGLKEEEIILTVRPPAEEAHYYNPESTSLFIELMTRISKTEGVRAILLPRHQIQEERLKKTYPEWFEKGKTIVPSRAVDGLNLIWLSDLVVSGGGTMNREAAALGVPVYSIFRGKIGSIDRRLYEQGRLVLIQNKKDVWEKIKFERRPKDQTFKTDWRPALMDIVDNIEDIIRIINRENEHNK